MKFKLTEENYYSMEANKKFTGYSQLKSFHQCEARCMAELRGEYEREETTALLVGSYVDAYLDGESVFGKFKVEHKEILKRDGTLKSDFVQADEIIERIESDEVFRDHLRGKRQVIMTGKIFGVNVKIKVDSLHDDMIVDGKIMRDFNDVWSDKESAYVPFWRAYLYDWQAFIYQEIVRQNTGKTLPFVLAAASKEKGNDLKLFKFTKETILNAGIEIQPVIRRLASVKRRAKPVPCGNCDYCRSKHVLKRGEYEMI